MSQRLILQAPAKVNLHLRVGRPAANGFHPLWSWMCTVGIFDTLTLEPFSQETPPVSGPRTGRTRSPDGCDAPGSAGAFAPGVLRPVVSPGSVLPPVWLPRVLLETDDPTLAADDTNLVVRAAGALAKLLQDRPGDRNGPVAASCDVAITLAKRIPMGAGLGGGSSDGATTLLGLNQLWAAGLDRDALAAVAATLGSDVPFFCHGPSSICTGRGEIVRPTPSPAARWAVLFLPAVHMPTPAVYRQFDAMNLGEPPAVTEPSDWSEWARLPAERLLARLVNDLETPAFFLRPDLGRLRSDLETAAGRPVRMSGSGSSLFTLYDHESQARAAVNYLSGKFPAGSRNQSPGSSRVGVSIEAVTVAPI